MEIGAGLEERVRAEYVPFLARSYTAEACGDPSLASQLLEQAVDEREPLAAITLADWRVDPMSHPGCQSLFSKMSLS